MFAKSENMFEKVLTNTCSVYIIKPYRTVVRFIGGDTMDRRMMNRELRANKVKRDKFNLAVIATILIVTVIVIFGSILTQAEEETILNSDNYYTSIEIKHADTLWDIAQKYNTDEELTTQEYIEEIMNVNGLTSDQIYEGQCIIVLCCN